MAVVDAVAAVVLLGEQVEHVRPDERDALGLVADPGRSAQVQARLVAGDVALLLGAEDERAVVPAGLDLRHRGEHGDAAGRAGGLVARRGHTPESGLDRGRHPAQVPWPLNNCPKALPTWIVSICAASTRASASVPATTSPRGR